MKTNTVLSKGLNPLNQVYVFNYGISNIQCVSAKRGLNPLNQVYVFNMTIKIIFKKYWNSLNPLNQVYVFNIKFLPIHLFRV